MNEEIDRIFNFLKKHIENKNKYNAIVMKGVVDETYPLVVFEVNSNVTESVSQDKFRLDQTRNVSFEISVFAINEGKTNSSIICDELANLVCEVMNGYYLMQGGVDAQLRNINSSQATKYVLHFIYNSNGKRNICYA